MNRANLTTIFYIILAVLVTVLLFNPFGGEKSKLSSNIFSAAAGSGSSEIKTSGATLIDRVAPGELLPISVKLVNFGGGDRVDVTLHYQIQDIAGNILKEETETVAVQTTAQFVKLIQLPDGIQSGRYIAKSDIKYAGQLVPATSSFAFDVERKIFGIFVSQFILYLTILLAVGIAFAVVSRLVMRRIRRTRLTPHDYSSIPKGDRLFYELISDTISQMRYRVGDRATELAADIEGLVIDENSGRVLKLTKNPAKIIALLVLRYEQELGEKVSFALRETDEETKEKLKPVDKNLVIVRKYFEK